ncbi:MAG: thioesterase [Paludibacteraceae bacterium]|nr:thioesterase [Paludibacteraceae bacterium]
MKTIYNFTVQHSDVDASRHIRLSDLERYLLESAGDSATSLGIGTQYLLDNYNATWVLTRFTVMMDELPMWGEQVEIETWVEGNVHMFSLRNFRIHLLSEAGKRVIGQATSAWTIINMESRQVDLAAYADKKWESVIDGERISLPRVARLGKLEEPSSVMPHTIHYTDLDYNNHCNSCKYLQFMLNACDSLTTIAPIRLDINYVKEVVKGEHIMVQVSESDQQIKYCLLTQNDEVSCTAMLSRY